VRRSAERGRPAPNDIDATRARPTMRGERDECVMGKAGRGERESRWDTKLGR